MVKRRTAALPCAGDGACSRYSWAEKILELDPQKEEQVVKKLDRASSSECSVPAQRPMVSISEERKITDTFGLRLPSCRGESYDAKCLSKREIMKTSTEIQKLEAHKTHPIAVILHLFYTELFEELRGYLDNLEGHFDLYLSLPEHLSDFETVIRYHYPEAAILLVPNRGRDLAPFVKFRK